MPNFQFILNPYLTGPQGFAWDDGRTLGHLSAQLVKATRPPVYPWAVAHPAPKGERWAPVTLHGTRKEAERAAGGIGAVFQGSFSQPREGLVIAKGRVFPAW
jgi:hypothetical protein